mmetsp:Transcript_43008/g.118938  ORF Transcript_43008/g.118938 Transcript_43008/m.118938 type:complete len:218 (-) Transcript_43008:1299-1952(-)
MDPDAQVCAAAAFHAEDPRAWHAFRQRSHRRLPLLGRARRVIKGRGHRQGERPGALGKRSVELPGLAVRGCEESRSGHRRGLQRREGTAGEELGARRSNAGLRRQGPARRSAGTLEEVRHELDERFGRLVAGPFEGLRICWYPRDLDVPGDVALRCRCDRSPLRFLSERNRHGEHPDGGAADHFVKCEAAVYRGEPRHARGGPRRAFRHPLTHGALH